MLQKVSTLSSHPRCRNKLQCLFLFLIFCNSNGHSSAVSSAINCCFTYVKFTVTLSYNNNKVNLRNKTSVTDQSLLNLFLFLYALSPTWRWRHSTNPGTTILHASKLVLKIQFLICLGSKMQLLYPRYIFMLLVSLCELLL